MDDASPRFRQDLEASSSEDEGVAFVDVTDPQTGTSFRLYDFEYQLALQLNGQPLREIVKWASEAYGVDLTAEGIGEFAGRLSELGFLETGGVAPVSPEETPAVGVGGGGGIGLNPPADGDDNAADEWMSAEGAKTATFVPDQGMLDAPSELTPVAPELPTMDVDLETRDEAEGPASAAQTPAPAPAKPADVTPPPRLFDLPGVAAPPPPRQPTAAAEAHAAPPATALPTIKPAEPPSARPAFNWAVDLDGKLQSEGAPRAVTAPPSNGSAPRELAPRPAPAAPPAPAATPVPPGAPERRQPPTPEAVQMAAFSPETPAPAAKPKSKAGRVIGVVILLLAIAGIVYAAIRRENARVAPAAVGVRVLSPKPAAVYRWFSGRGTVTDHEARTLAFETSGMLGELAPPGTAFAAGDILGRLRAAPPIEALLSRQRARLTFYQQMRESMQAANNRPELRQAEIRLVEKQRLLDETNASLAKVVVRASEPGEVIETLAKVGLPVRANAPVVRVKGRMLHGEFELDAEEIARAGTLTFCRVEVIGLGPRASNAPGPAAPGTAADVGSPDAQAAPRFVDCAFEKPAPGAQKLRVTLPDNLGLVPGQPLRLARQRHDAVFPIPAAAVSDAGGRRSIWVASAAGTAERRDVVIADLSDDALISDGLRVGDEVIVDAPADLQPGRAIIVAR